MSNLAALNVQNYVVNEAVHVTVCPPPQTKTCTVSLYDADPALYKNIKQLRASLDVNQVPVSHKVGNLIGKVLTPAGVGLVLWAYVDHKSTKYKEAFSEEVAQKHKAIRTQCLEGITDEKFKALFSSQNGLGYLEKERNVAVKIGEAVYRSSTEIAKALEPYRLTTVEMYTTIMMCTGGFLLMPAQLGKVVATAIQGTNTVSIHANKQMVFRTEYNIHNPTTMDIVGKKCVEMTYDIAQEQCTFKITDLEFVPEFEVDADNEEPAFGDEGEIAGNEINQ